MLTVNADDHPVMKQFHKPQDEKRTPLIIRPDLHQAWLAASPTEAKQLMDWHHMPDLAAEPAPKA
jgi:putative SOS response-associated peptidase YedK